MSNLSNNNINNPVVKVSRAIFLLPLFFGIIGGVIGCVYAWNKDRGTAVMSLILGFVFGIIWFAVFFMIGLAATPVPDYSSSYNYYGT